MHGHTDKPKDREQQKRLELRTQRTNQEEVYTTVLPQPVETGSNYKVH